MAYYQLEPFGDERDDIRMARQATVISNTIINAWTGKEGPFTEEDMMLKFDALQDEDEPDNAVDVAQKMESYFGSLQKNA
jgi:hypothetical protein